MATRSSSPKSKSPPRESKEIRGFDEDEIKRRSPPKSPTKVSKPSSSSSGGIKGFSDELGDQMVEWIDKVKKFDEYSKKADGECILKNISTMLSNMSAKDIQRIKTRLKLNCCKR